MEAVGWKREENGLAPGTTRTGSQLEDRTAAVTVAVRTTGPACVGCAI